MEYCRAGNRGDHFPIRRSFTRCCDREVWSRGRWWAAQPKQSNTKPRDSCHWRRRSNPTCCWMSWITKALYTVVQLAMHIYPTVPNSFEPFFCTCNISLFSSVDRIIAATGFVRLPVGSQRRRSAVSLAPYSPLMGGPQTRPRCKRSCPTRRPVGERASSPAAQEHCP